MGIVVITMMEKHPRTGQKVLVASHGIEEGTGRAVTFPGDHPAALGAEWDEGRGEWIIPDPKESTGPRC
jgi:hypothetical protein